MPVRRVVAILVLGSALIAPRVACAQTADTVMAQFFSVWDDNARVTPQTVGALYARRVTYYGRSMTTDEVFANKRAFIRRWPDRRYAVVPGSAQKGCSIPNVSCTIEVTLAWHAASRARGVASSGWTRVSLALRREDGDLKIVSEQGRPVSRPDGG